MRFVEPYIGLLHRCVTSGFDKYLGMPAHIIAEHDGRAATSSVHSHIVHAISREFAEIEGACIINVRGLQVLNLHDRLVFRFKKVNEAGFHKNNPTKQQERFDRQLSLPELPRAATRLTLGYEPDPAFSQIVRVTVGCPLGHKSAPLWLAQLNTFDTSTAWVDITPSRIPGTERYERFKDEDAAAV